MANEMSGFMRSHNTLFYAGKFTVDDYISGFVHDGTRELRAAELESETTTERYTHDDVMAGIRAKLKAVQNV